jgi:hypothetical protein
MAGVKIIPDLTIAEQGVGPAQDVWPDTAAGSGGTLAPATTPGAVGVEGPAGANVVAPGALFGQVLTTLGPPATPTSGPLQAEWISPTNNPTWNQATWFVDPQNSASISTQP